MTTQLEQDVKLAESAGFSTDINIRGFGKIHKATNDEIHAFANAIREQSKASLRDVPDGWKTQNAAPTREDGKEALRDLVTKAVTEAVNEYSDYHYEGNEPDISNTVDRVLKSK